MSRWFDRVDTNHDGAVDREEFLADARRQFAVMDLDKSGVVTPAELAQYRAAFALPDRQTSRQRRDSDGKSEALPSDLPDPVMAADVNLRNRVSREDFLAYSQRQFTALDASRHGRLGKTDLQRFCGN